MRRRDREDVSRRGPLLRRRIEELHARAFDWVTRVALLQRRAIGREGRGGVALDRIESGAGDVNDRPCRGHFGRRYPARRDRQATWVAVRLRRIEIGVPGYVTVATTKKLRDGFFANAFLPKVPPEPKLTFPTLDPLAWSKAPYPLNTLALPRIPICVLPVSELISIPWVVMPQMNALLICP